MHCLKYAVALVFVSTLSVYAKDVGIKFDEMAVGTTLVTQSLSGKKRVSVEKYIGKRNGFHLMEESWLSPDGTSEPLGEVLYDNKGRRVRSERSRGSFIHTPFSCHFALGECTHIYDYPNQFSKKKNKRTKSVGRYKNRFEGDTLYVTWKMADDSIAEVPIKLGPYNLRVSSEYKNALGQLRGHKLIEIIEPSAGQPTAVAKGESAAEVEVATNDGALDCKALYAKLKAKAPGDVSICEPTVKEPKFYTCKKPTTHTAGIRPASHVVLALDASGSMAGKLGGKTKMATAKQEAGRFLNALERDVPIGLVVYGHRGDNTEAGKEESCAAVEWAKKVGRGRGGIEKNIKRLKPVGWTPLAGTLDYLKDELPKLRKKRSDKESVPVVYVISDGKETCGGDPVASAKALHESGVKAAVNIIGFDVDDETRAQLEAISEAGGGRYFPAEDSKALRKQLNAAKESQAELARYKYCALLNIGAASVVYHNAQIDMIGCHHRESDKKRLDLIKKWIKEFDTPEEKACAAKVRHMAGMDDVTEDGRWLTKAAKRLRAAREAAVDAAEARWSLEALEKKE